ncbi:MAG: hypothetical protein V5A34_01865 [Halapricum sp.]
MSDEGDPFESDNPFQNPTDEETKQESDAEEEPAGDGEAATGDTASEGETEAETGGADDEVKSEGPAGIQDHEDTDRETDLEMWEDRLDQREEGLDQRAARLKERAGELDDREAELEAEQEELDEWRSDLDARQSRLEKREAELDEREAEIRESENELAERAADLDEKEETLHNYVGNNLGDVESSITGTVREAVTSAVDRIEPGQAEVDQETVESAIATAMDDYSSGRGRFGIVGNLLLGLIGLVFVLGGATVLFSTETTAIPRAFSDAGLNYGAAAILIFIGLAVNLSAAADRI